MLRRPGSISVDTWIYFHGQLDHFDWNIHIQTINDIEGGRKWVSDKTMTKLSAALNVECYQLLLPKLSAKHKKETNSTQQLWE